MSLLSQLRPREGRWRPGLMACDQATNVIYTQLSGRDVRDVFRTQDFQQALADAPPGSSRAVAFSKIPEAAKWHLAALNHELDHLRRQFSTSCGLFQLHLRSKLIGTCQHLILERRAKADPIPFPLFSRFEGRDWLARLVADRERFFEREASFDIEAKAVVRGLAAAAAINGVESGATLSTRVLADAGVSFSSGAGQFAPIGFVTPHFEPEVDESLGALHLLEHMAVLQELCWHTHLGADIGAWRTLVECDVRYRLVLSIWSQSFPEDGVLDEDRLRSTDLITDVYRIHPVEFYALVDLALWVPFTPTGLCTVRRPLRWEDVQPGHRFLSGLSLLKGSGRPLTPLTSDLRESRFTETQRWIADEMGWERAEDLATTWYHYLMGDHWFQNAVFAGFLENPTVLIARTVLARRLAQPFDVVLNNVSWAQDPACQFAVWMTDEGIDGCRMHNMGDQRRGNITQQTYYIFRGCERLLFGKPSRLLRLDEAARRDALDVLATELSCPGWDAGDFRQAAAPAFGL